MAKGARTTATQHQCAAKISSLCRCHGYSNRCFLDSQLFHLFSLSRFTPIQLPFNRIRGRLSNMDTVSVPEASTKKPKVCVTGASGYVASALVKLLLRKGYSVHATVRDPENRSKVEHLLKLPGADAGLHLFKADLLEEGSFDAAVAGCEGVFHVASPLIFHPTDPEVCLCNAHIHERSAEIEAKILFLSKRREIHKISRG
eukprot:TRINITY_DN4991_c0_g1_i2.p1 TRINITY_DN4991_c0_g1~~TRINITY_DN4991_c0_g1_i2.p1  ORF type:complete len:210 (+),score=5.06 TRINITY_DN4991_c0_g1_i2:28-630(+)